MLALALGFLYGEGVCASSPASTEVAALDDGVREHRSASSSHRRPSSNPRPLTRNVYTTSSCGVCGKASIDAVRVRSPTTPASDRFVDRRGDPGDAAGAALRRARRPSPAPAASTLRPRSDASGRIDRGRRGRGPPQRARQAHRRLPRRRCPAADRLGAALQRPRQLRAGAEGGHGRAVLSWPPSGRPRAWRSSWPRSSA